MKDIPAAKWVILAVSMTFITLAIVTDLALSRYESGTKLKLVAVLPRTGSSGGLPVYVFDRAGNYVAKRIDFDYPETLQVEGDSPLYSFGLDQLPDGYEEGQGLPPEVVTKGLELFPLYFGVRLPEEDLLTGETRYLEASTRVLEAYPGQMEGGFVYPIEIGDDEIVTVSFSLLAPSFDVSSLGGPDARYGVSRQDSNAREWWAISPKPGTLGHQELLVSLKGYQADGSNKAMAPHPLIVELDVYQVGGLNPLYTRLASLLLPAVTIASGIVILLKAFPELRTAYRQAWQKGGHSSQPRRKPRRK